MDYPLGTVVAKDEIKTGLASSSVCMLILLKFRSQLLNH